MPAGGERSSAQDCEVLEVISFGTLHTALRHCSSRGTSIRADSLILAPFPTKTSDKYFSKNCLSEKFGDTFFSIPGSRDFAQSDCSFVIYE